MAEWILFKQENAPYTDEAVVIDSIEANTVALSSDKKSIIADGVVIHLSDCIDDILSPSEFEKKFEYMNLGKLAEVGRNDQPR
jgi:hypothetical protein